MIPNTSLPRRRNMKRTAIRLRTRTRPWATTLYMTFLVSRVMNGGSLLVGTHRRGGARWREGGGAGLVWVGWSLAGAGGVLTGFAARVGITGPVCVDSRLEPPATLVIIVNVYAVSFVRLVTRTFVAPAPAATVLISVDPS